MSKRLLKFTSLVASMTLLSRMLGLVREIVIAHFFGASAGADAFFVVFKIPNFMRRLFAEGAFSQAFVPVLSEYKQKLSFDEVHELIDYTAGTLATVLLVVTILAELAVPLLIMVFAPGYLNDPHRFAMASMMLHITFPYLLLISLTAFSGAILNTYQSFAPPAFTPVLLNVALIAAAIFLRPMLQLPISALAWGVLIAGMVQLLFQLPFLWRRGLLPRPKLSFQHKGVNRILKLMLPALFGASIYQLNLMLDTIFASFLKVGSISWLYYADRLMQFPLGVFGVAIATVILPSLSQQHADASDRSYSDTINWALRFILLVGLPAAVGLYLLAGPMLATLLHYGAFNSDDVLMAQQSLWAFSIGVPAFMITKVLVSAFYSKQDMRTPVKVGFFVMNVNVIFNAILIGPLAHAGLALATSLAAFVNASVLFVVLYRRQIFRPTPGWLSYLLRLFFACAFMIIILTRLTPELSKWLNADWQWRVMHLVGLISIAIVSYFSVLFLSGLRFRSFLSDDITS